MNLFINDLYERMTIPGYVPPDADDAALDEHIFFPASKEEFAVMEEEFAAIEAEDRRRQLVVSDEEGIMPEGFPFLQPFPER